MSTERINNDSNEPTEETPNVTQHRVSRDDLLLGENYQLRVMNLSLQIEILQQELAEKKAQLATKQQELLAFRKELSEKYNIDFTRVEIEAGTGLILKKVSHV